MVHDFVNRTPNGCVLQPSHGRRPNRKLVFFESTRDVYIRQTASAKRGKHHELRNHAHTVFICAPCLFGFGINEHSIALTVFERGTS